MLSANQVREFLERTQQENLSWSSRIELKRNWFLKILNAPTELDDDLSIEVKYGLDSCRASCALSFFLLPLASSYSVVTLAFIGDVSFDSAVRYFHKKGSCHYNTTFLNVASYLREADLAIANLESPLINSDMRHNARLKFSTLLSADSDSIQALSFAGIDIVTLANNHYNDYGSRPVNYSVDLLSQIGVQAFGYNYGRKEDDKPQTPLLVKVNGIKLGFLGYCSEYRDELTPKGKLYSNCTEKRGNLTAGPAIYSDEAATRDVDHLKGKVDVIVVFMHWGVEYLTVPTGRQKKQASHLKFLGVQIIIGAHPHVLEGHTTSGTNLIAYSLGNLLFAPRNKNKLFYCNREPSEETVKKFERYMTSPAGLADPTTHSRIMRVKVDKYVWDCILNRLDCLLNKD